MPAPLKRQRVKAIESAFVCQIPNKILGVMYHNQIRPFHGREVESRQNKSNIEDLEAALKPDPISEPLRSVGPCMCTRLNQTARPLRLSRAPLSTHSRTSFCNQPSGTQHRSRSRLSPIQSKTPCEVTQRAANSDNTH